MSCIFCQIIEEADPVKVPEIGDDYAVIKGKKIGLKNDRKFVKIAKNWPKSTEIDKQSIKIDQ